MDQKVEKKINPIVSYGIIAFTMREKQPYFLLYQRRDSYEYMDFLRGIWNTDHDVKNLFSLMSMEERQRIRDYTFKELWDDLWVTHTIPIYKDFTRCEKKYQSIKERIPKLLNTTSTNIIEPPWGFPKGRKNSNEKHLDAAVREFTEETNISIPDYKLFDIQPVIERFVGSNGKYYNTVYFIIELENDICVIPERKYTPHCIRQYTLTDEANMIEWSSYEDACLKLDHIKQEMLTDIYQQIKLKK